MSLVDLGLLTGMALGVYAGHRRGSLRPLLTEAVVVLAGFVLYFHFTAVYRLLPAAFPRVAFASAFMIAASVAGGFLAAAVAAFVYRSIPALRQADRRVGMAVHGVFAFVALYLILLVLVGLDQALAPIHRARALGPAQVAALRSSLLASPQLGAAVDQDQLVAMQADAEFGAIPITQLGTYEGPLGFYELQVRPQLVSSRLAPAVLWLGGRLPVVGRTATLPGAQPRDQPASR